jgi:hypothetical protein
MNTTLIAVFTCVLAAGCTPSVDDRARSGADLLGSSGQDGADHACNIVLLGVDRPAAATGGGYATHCRPEGCFFVWEGTLDVSAAAVAAGATPTVQFQTTSVAPTWYSVSPRPIAGAAAGGQRYAFTIDDHTVTDGMSTTSLLNTVLQIEPLLTLPDSSRLFDHNRNHDEFGNYVLDRNDFWSIANSPAACAPPPSATLRFLSSWKQVQEGAIVAGGKLTIEYDPARLSQCTGISGHARFSPGGQLVTLAGAAPWTTTVPEGATGVALWFETSGGTCATQWDSNYGCNYSFPVASAPAPDVLWAGNWRSMVSRGCMDSDWVNGVTDPLVLDSWALTRATCLQLDLEIWAPGLTDAADAHPELVAAQVLVSRDGGPLETGWLDFVGRVGNNYRYRWDIGRAGIDFYYTPWDAISYQVRFSTNGNDWSGPDGGVALTLKRGADWCPSSWGSARCP